VWLAADGPAAVAAIERGIETARRAGAREVLAEALEEQARILMTSGRSEEAVAASRQAIALADELGLDAISLQATITLGTAIADLGDAPLTILQAAADRADEQSNPRGLLRALNNAIFVLWNRGELQAARERHALAVSRLARFPLATVSAWLLAGDAGGLVESGEWERALAAMDEYRRALRGRPYYLDADVESLRAFVGFARGEPAALVALEAAIDPLATVQDMQVDLPARYVLAFAYRLLGRTSDADAIALRLAAIPIHERSHIARQGALAGVVSVLTGRDLIEGVEGASRWIAANRALVEGRFEDAHETLVAMGARLSAALTCFAAAERRGEAGEDTEPWASLAAGFFEEVGAVRLLRELEALGATRRSA
jgi:tetratricopeptide (TPR) repeat protein